MNNKLRAVESIKNFIYDDHRPGLNPGPSGYETEILDFCFW